MDVMAARGLVPEDETVLREILSRRDPDLARSLDRTDGMAPDERQREGMRRAVVDELCDLSPDDDRRALALQELLTRLGEEPRG
jgi:hypothetical protein